MIKKKCCVTWKSSNVWKGKQKRPANIFLFFLLCINDGGSKEDFLQRKLYLQ